MNHGGWWRPEWRVRRSPTLPLRVGYYVWRFPALSDTLIRREVQALREAGIPLEVFADQPDKVGDAGLIETTHYLLPRNPERLGRAKRFLTGESRLRYWKVLLYTILHRYGSYKTWREDLQVFERAVDLAYHLNEHQITHLHTPWADRTAFTALLAAALLGIPYSVEGRAHDLHRAESQYALREKFSNAEFVTTNSDYNARVIESLLDSARPAPHVIRELFPMAEFSPCPDKTPSSPFRLLCVARLIEEKGLVYLLRACARLRTSARVRDRGTVFCCEIIGGPEEPTYVNYLIALKRLHRELELEDCVFFLGAQPYAQVLEAYRRADLFVLPCVVAENGGRDISPNSLIEAMGMGLPVISTQLSAISEIVEDGVSGILVPPNDDAALAEAIEALMPDEERRHALGARARASVMARYDASVNVGQFAALFRGERK